MAEGCDWSGLYLYLVSATWGILHILFIFFGITASGSASLKLCAFKAAPPWSQSPFPDSQCPPNVSPVLFSALCSPPCCPGPIIYSMLSSLCHSCSYYSLHVGKLLLSIPCSTPDVIPAPCSLPCFPGLKATVENPRGSVEKLSP